MYYGDIQNRLEQDVTAAGAAGVIAFRVALDAAITSHPAKEHLFTVWTTLLSSYGEDPIALSGLVFDMMSRAGFMGMSEVDIAAAYESTLT